MGQQIILLHGYSTKLYFTYMIACMMHDDLCCSPTIGAAELRLSSAIASTTS